ncbi:hypothetical protein MD484_g8928, partial [Candolleomyces efflorescens]
MATCEAIFLHELRFQASFPPETSVETARDSIAKSLEAKLGSLSQSHVAAPHKWQVDFFPQVKNPSEVLLSSLPEGRLHMVFSTISKEPTVTRAFGHTVARVTAHFEANLKQITESLLDLDLSQKRCVMYKDLLEDEMKKRDEMDKKLSKKTKEVETAMSMMEEQMALIRKKDKELDEKNKALKQKDFELKNQIDQIQKGVEEAKALSRMAHPLLLRILMDDTRAEIARILQKEDWWDLKNTFKDSMPSVYEEIKHKLSPKAWELVSQGNKYRDAGNASAHNATPASILPAIESLEFGAHRDAFADMLNFTYSDI